MAAYADILRAHPRLLVKVDAHTGVGAPPPIAPQHSMARGAVVAKFLVELGVDPSRIEVALCFSQINQ